MALAHNLGYPRIGYQQGTKKIIEAYWHREVNSAALKQYAFNLQGKHWTLQSQVGLDILPIGDFCWFDHVLNLSILLGNIPGRFLHDNQPGIATLDTLFYMFYGDSRDHIRASACRKAQWFNTAYHYVVPEFTQTQVFHLQSHEHDIFNYTQHALNEHYCVKPVLLGPLSFLWLGACADQPFNKLCLLDTLLPVYEAIFLKLNRMGVEWIQIDEPILSIDLPEAWRKQFKKVYKHFNFSGLKCLLATYFAGLHEHLSDTFELTVDGFHMDGCAAPSELGRALTHLPPHKVLSIGVINGHNVWINDLHQSLNLLENLHAALGDRLWIAPSCSLLHVPLDLEEESQLDPILYTNLAFARQKIEEIALLSTGLNAGRQSIQLELDHNRKKLESRRRSERNCCADIQERLSALTSTDMHRKDAHPIRNSIQHKNIHLPLLPTSMISPLPQPNSFVPHQDAVTPGIYESKMRTYIASVIAQQVDLDLDILVHAAPSYIDAAEYYAACISGITITQHAWIQSDGTHHIKLPIIDGDIKRMQPLLSYWMEYAQSLTTKPIKALLTGPITMLTHAFVREDQPIATTAHQMALVLRDEIQSLEAAGIGLIQIDEPGFEKYLPQKKEDRIAYLDCAHKSFKLATAAAQNGTQIHTHISTDNLSAILPTIAAWDADILTIRGIKTHTHLTDILMYLPDAHDVHLGLSYTHLSSLPSLAEMEALIKYALQMIPIERCGINADLLTYATSDDTKIFLQRLVMATARVRLPYLSDIKTSTALNR